jgi:hypothetical protein
VRSEVIAASIGAAAAAPLLLSTILLQLQLAAVIAIPWCVCLCPLPPPPTRRADGGHAGSASLARRSAGSSRSRHPWLCYLRGNS